MARMEKIGEVLKPDSEASRKNFSVFEKYFFRENQNFFIKFLSLGRENLLTLRNRNFRNHTILLWKELIVNS